MLTDKYPRTFGGVVAFFICAIPLSLLYQTDIFVVICAILIAISLGMDLTK